MLREKASLIITPFQKLMSKTTKFISLAYLKHMNPPVNSSREFDSPALVQCESCNCLQFVEAYDVDSDCTYACYGDCNADTSNIPARSFRRVHIPKTQNTKDTKI